MMRHPTVADTRSITRSFVAHRSSSGVNALTFAPRIRRPAWLPLLMALAAVLAGSRAEADIRLLVSEADATIVLDTASDAWTIGARSIAVTLGLDPNQALVVRRVANPLTGRILIDTAAPDTRVTLDGQSLVLAEGATGLRFEGANAVTWHGGVHLTFTYSHQALQTTIVRHYACYPA